MAIQTIHDDEAAADGRIYPDMPCYVATDAEFRAAVAKGQESARAGRTVTLDQVEAELRQMLSGPG